MVEKYHLYKVTTKVVEDYQHLLYHLLSLHLLLNIKKLWNKEVTFFCNEHDTIPTFRGWIKRTQINFNTLQVFAQDAIGYMVKGGEQSLTEVELTDNSNIDGLTVGAAIKKIN